MNKTRRIWMWVLAGAVTLGPVVAWAATRTAEVCPLPCCPGSCPF
jgi:hypothetical protein